MFVTRLRQFAFRNVAIPELRFGEGVTAIVGPNAAGKSNLLDAVYLAVSGDLPLGTVADALRFGESEGFVAAEIRTARVTLHTHVGLAPSRKVLRLDDAPARRSDLSRAAAAVRITPQDAELVHGGPAARRAWLDDLLTRLSPRYGALTRAYGRRLEQRNAALRHGADGATLAAFSGQLAEAGDEIVALRRRLVARAGELATGAYAEVAGTAQRLEVRLLASQGERPLAEALHLSAEEERSRGMTVVGPHRDELSLLLGDRSVRTFGSRGEARTTSLALRVAEHRLLSEKHGEAPVLLLDDFSAELDADRRGFLLDLAHNSPQALVSGTEPPPSAQTTLLLHEGALAHDAQRQPSEVRDG